MPTLFSYRPAEFSIRGGRAYVLRIVPTIHKSTPEFQKLSVEQRKCRFNDEQLEDQFSIFKYYTQKTCIFECTLKNVVPSKVSLNK
jgi:hypothetical protein